MDAEESERDEECEGGFRAVGGGAERVEAKDRNAGEGTDLLPTLVTGGQRLSKEQIENFHAGSAFIGGFSDQCDANHYIVRVPNR